MGARVLIANLIWNVVLSIAFFYDGNRIMGWYWIFALGLGYCVYLLSLK